MARFAHFLLTRFNLREPGFTLDDAWYEQRFRLFESFCLPSVQAQSSQSFHWLLLADQRTPERYRSSLESYQAYANVQLHWLDGFDRSRIARIVREQLDDPVSHLISSTLDNDDALALDFVAQVQGQFAAQTFELVNFTQGLRYDLRSEKLYTCELETNPFISLIEKVEPGQQVRTIAGCLPHSQIKGRFRQIRDVETAPLWLQVIHGRNAAPTGTWGRPRVSISLLDSLFKLAYDVPQEKDSALVFRAQHARARLERGVINLLSDEQRLRVQQLLQKDKREHDAK
jgi:hypothetical protein